MVCRFYGAIFLFSTTLRLPHSNREVLRHTWWVPRSREYFPKPWTKEEAKPRHYLEPRNEETRFHPNISDGHLRHKCFLLRSRSSSFGPVVVWWPEPIGRDGPMSSGKANLMCCCEAKLALNLSGPTSSVGISLTSSGVWRVWDVWYGWCAKLCEACVLWPNAIGQLSPITSGSRHCCSCCEGFVLKHKKPDSIGRVRHDQAVDPSRVFQ